MAEINVMAEEKDEEQFADVFLLLIAIEGFVAFEFASYIGQLFVYPFHLGFFTFTC